MNENDENRFGYLRKNTIEELERIKRELLDDNDYMASHRITNSEQETEFHRDTIFNNEQIAFIDEILKEKKGKGRG